MTKDQAYLAMYSFLDAHFSRGESDVVATILGGLSLLDDGEPFDPAMKADWEEAVEKALTGKVDARLVLRKT